MNHYFLLSVIILAFGVVFFLILKSRNIHIWFLPYLIDLVRQSRWKKESVTHIYFAFVDHYEPFRDGADATVARKIVGEWKAKYPPIAVKHKDSDGNHPQHSFFYPEEEYDPAILSMLADIKAKSVGDVEVHLHHQNDTAENLVSVLKNFAITLGEQHGCLRQEPEESGYSFAFIHGNWALDNSAGGHWCGVDNEIQALIDAGCYVDMTLP